MPLQTAHGYPYPIDTDPLANGYNNIAALATKIETNLRGGVWSANGFVAAVGNGGSKSIVVTFPAGLFPTMPNVVVSPWVSSPNTQHAAPSGITNASVTVVVHNATGATTDIYFTLIAHLA